MPSRDFCTSSHKSPNVHAVFERYDPEILHVFNVSLPSLLRMFFFVFCFFFRRKCGKSLKTQISNNNKKDNNPNIWRGKKREKFPTRARLGRGTLNTCRVHNFRVVPRKRRGHWTLANLGVLEPACTTGMICVSWPQIWKYFITTNLYYYFEYWVPGHFEVFILFLDVELY